MYGNERAAKDLRQFIKHYADGGYEVSTYEVADEHGLMTEEQLLKLRNELNDMCDVANEMVETLRWQQGLIDAALYYGKYKRV